MFEQNTTLTLREIRGRIQTQIGIYMPYIELINLEFYSGGANETSFFEESFTLGSFNFNVDQEENLLYVSLEYKILPLNLKTLLKIEIR